MTEDEIRGWQVAISTEPMNKDISRLEPVAYKFIDK